MGGRWSLLLTAARLFCLAALAAVGCGTPLVPGEVVRQPIFSLSGTTTSDVAPMGALRLTALWVDPLGQRNDRPWPIVGILGPPTTSDAFTLDFSAPPPAEMIRHISSANDPSVTVAAFAFAELVAFDDLDRDGTFHVGQVATGSRMIAPDVYRGAALVHALFYVEQPHAPTVIPELDPILGSSVGYHLAIASCDATTTNGRFVLAQDAAVIKIKLGSAQPTLPQNRGCLQSHVASLAP